ncbi:MBL fold metallo-hydrolase [Streptomyces sp. NPDC059740]|uniref:MBL fold metallo-hydrolase n=1 Tax=Streptomyces sp. NPDC059740 TaxID=3346926 RepID=UPI00364640B7
MTEQSDPSCAHPRPTAASTGAGEGTPGAPPTAALRPLGEHRTWPRDFTDRLTAPLPGVRALARLARDGKLRPAAATLHEITELPVAPAPLPPADPGTLSLTWVGHASWIVRVGPVTVLTDPVWSRRILATPPRITPVGVPWAELPPVDAVLISHNHYDHLDLPTLRRLPPGTPLLLPAGLARWARRRRFTHVTELDWWEKVELHGVTFGFVPAHHWSKRTPTDTCRSLWGGWVITAPDGRRVYFAGDTGYGHWFEEIGARHPGIDVALLPVGAYDPRWMLRPVHTDPEEAVRACRDVGARAMAPMHHGTFLLSGEPPMEPLRRVRTAWAAAGRRREDLWDLPVGASRVLAPPPVAAS